MGFYPFCHTPCGRTPHKNVRSGNKTGIIFPTIVATTFISFALPYYIASFGGVSFSHSQMCYPTRRKTCRTHIISFLKSTSCIFLNIFLFNTLTNMSPACTENDCDILKAIWSLRTFIVMSKVWFFSCRSMHKEITFGIIQCARATSPVQMGYLSQPSTNNELSGIILLHSFCLRR